MPTVERSSIPRLPAPRVDGPPPAASAVCANCGALAPAAYCAACGQEQHDLHRSVRALAGEALDNFVGWDGKVLATLRTLVLRPGALTGEFLAGRRVRYLRPLRVYLTASVLFFLAMRADVGDGGAVRFGMDGDTVRLSNTPTPAAGRAVPIVVTAPATAGRAVPAVPRATRPPAADLTSRAEAWIERTYQERMRALAGLSAAERNRRLSEAFLGHLGTTMVVLLPFFAVLTRMLWREAGLFYAEHVVFALHAHAAGMLGLALVRVAPGAWAALPALWVPAHAALAARRVFGIGREGRWRTGSKIALLGTAYGLALAAGLLLTLLVAVFDEV